MILTPLQKLPKNVGNSGKIIVAIGFEWLPKVQKIAKSGHTACNCKFLPSILEMIAYFCDTKRSKVERAWSFNIKY